MIKSWNASGTPTIVIHLRDVVSPRPESVGFVSDYQLRETCIVEVLPVIVFLTGKVVSDVLYSTYSRAAFGYESKRAGVHNWFWYITIQIGLQNDC